ncbi:MEMO1 family [Cantharellus anzutake]|uniref:MEMO1 family n=1 Tax=Cantharellus anzutake TaxID=1750568 RepID=UPI00190488A2|nr:MEMO1 family [Cantharellus anzutake]KAF8332335.1 MEMO1 family [Cantharellus anzutake]
MTTSRQATHAGSWYSSHGPTLNDELKGWLSAVTPEAGETNASFEPPIKGCKAIIAPHAGYAYSGPTAAWAYKSIHTTNIKRVFILGPSHHVYLAECALSQCQTYQTPIGDLPIDLETTKQLEATGKFSPMSESTDEDEHSIEMHLPYVRKIFEGKDIKIVPILVGAINIKQEKSYGEILAPYLDAPDTFFVISSDFCHWGTRFSYTFYYPTPLPCSKHVKLSQSEKPTSHSIHASIRALDHEGMNALKLDRSADTEQKSAEDAHDAFAQYLARTKNTICGRHPIGVLMGALAALEKGKAEKRVATLGWVRYAQSSACETIRDSSVSYASAYVVFQP